MEFLAHHVKSPEGRVFIVIALATIIVNIAYDFSTTLQADA